MTVRSPVPASLRDKFPTAAGTETHTHTQTQSQTKTDAAGDLFLSPRPSLSFSISPSLPLAPLSLTGAPVGGDAAAELAAPGLHGDGVEAPGRQRGEVALVGGGRHALVLQHRVVVADQHHIVVQVTCCIPPVYLERRETQGEEVRQVRSIRGETGEVSGNSDIGESSETGEVSER